MKSKKFRERGHIHLLAAVLIVAALIGAMGYYVYRVNYAPSKVTDPTVKAELKKVSTELKGVNLASVKGSVDSLNNTQHQIKK